MVLPPLLLIQQIIRNFQGFLRKTTNANNNMERNFPKKEDTTQIRSAQKQSLPKLTRHDLSIEAHQKSKRRMVKEALIDWLPDEALYKIFSYLPASSLCLAAIVCSRWNRIASDNVLWEKLFRHHKACGKRRRTKYPKAVPALFWKNECIKCCAETRERLLPPQLKKLSPLTGMPARTNDVIKKLGTKWKMGLLNQHKEERMFDHCDVFYFNMAVCVRWFALNFPSVDGIATIRLYAANPVFCDNQGNGFSDGPQQLSMMYECKFSIKDMLSNPPAVSNKTIDLYALADGILIALWKDGSIAFVVVTFHGNNLVQRCLYGSRGSPYIPTSHLIPVSEVDSRYGLHSYTLIIEMRSIRTSFWCEYFPQLRCREGDLGDGFAIFRVVGETCFHQRCSINGQMLFNWKTELFRGVIENFCIVDITLLDDQRRPMWCSSCSAQLINAESSLFRYRHDGEPYELTCSDDVGRIQATLMQEEHQFFIVDLHVALSLRHINKWFNTNY